MTIEEEFADILTSRKESPSGKGVVTTRRLQTAFVTIVFCLIQTGHAAQDSPSSAPALNMGVVNIEMRNVTFRFTDRIAVNIIVLAGSLMTTHGGLPVFDNKDSFDLRVDSGTIRVSTTALTNDLNDYVFSKSDAPLKMLAITTEGNELVLKGVLANKDVFLLAASTSFANPACNHEGWRRWNEHEIRSG